MRILVACEESQAVTIELRRMGHEAYSCDVLPCSGGHPEWHIQADVRIVLSQHWDAIIAFPDCTYLTVSNNSAMANGCSQYTKEEAIELRKNAILFFRLFVDHPCKIKAIENPIGIMSSEYRKPDQYIQPFQFGEDASKKTCLWLFGLQPLQETNRVKGRMINGKEIFGNQTPSGQNKLGPSDDRASLRSKTYPGIAKAMAEQWFILK